jgi:hypothetical protein
VHDEAPGGQDPQTPLTTSQVLPVGQSAFEVHPTHTPRTVSQTGVAPEHWALLVHDSVHPTAGLHAGAAPPHAAQVGPQAAVVVHAEQLAPLQRAPSERPPAHDISSPMTSASRIRCVSEVPQRKRSGVAGVMAAVPRSESATAQSMKTSGSPPKVLAAGDSRALAATA